MQQLQKALKPKTQANRFVDPNPVEAIRSIGNGTIQSLTTDLVGGGISDVWKQFLGGGTEKNKKQSAGDLQEGQDLNLSQAKKEKKQDNREAGIDYRREILHGSERITSHENQALIQQIEMIVVELKRLASSSKELQIEFKDVVVTQNVVKPGKYHQNFFEWVLIVIRSARMRVEDAGAWLLAMKGKKGKKQSQNYWERFKKEGTTFGLSNERVVSTQTG